MMMKKFFSLLLLMMSFLLKSQDDKSPLMVRLAEIEIYTEYLEDYIEEGKKVAKLSVDKEKGVIVLLPLQVDKEKNKIRVLEIYANQEAYKEHILTPHFLEYKQNTQKMVKSLVLLDTTLLEPEIMQVVFSKYNH